MDGGLSIGQVAKQAGVGVETIRFYERRGLIEEPPRGASGYRRYSPEVVSRIQFIKRGKELGFSLREIQDLLTLRVDERTGSTEVRSRAEAKLAEIDAKISDLRRMRKALTTLTAQCRGRGPVGECPILEAMAAGTPTRTRRRPVATGRRNDQTR